MKVSILMSYFNVFGRLPWFRITLLSVGVLVIMWLVGFFFASLFGCVPVAKSWDPSLPGHCIMGRNYALLNSVSVSLLSSCCVELVMRLSCIPQPVFGHSCPSLTPDANLELENG